MRWPWQKKSMEAGRSFKISDTAEFLNNGFNSYVSCLAGAYTETNLISLFLSIPEVFAPINEIASRVIAARFYVRDTKTGEPVINDKYLNKLLASPNPYSSFSDLIYSWVAYKYVTGNSYLYANVPETLKFNYQNVSTLFTLPSHNTEIKLKEYRTSYYNAVSSQDIIDRYIVKEPSGYYKDIPPELVQHQRFIDLGTSLNGYANAKGVSPLLAAEKPMSNLIQVYEARNIIYLKRGALGMIVSRKSDESGMQALNKREKEELINDYHNTYGLSGGRSPVAITSIPVDFLSIGMSIAELLPFEETKADAAAIYGVLQVPFDLAPKPEGSTYENQKQSEIKLYNNVVIGEAQEFCSAVNSLLKLDTVNKEIAADFTDIDVLQEDQKLKSEIAANNTKTYRQQYLDGLITKNEYRVNVGQQPVEGQDYYIDKDPLAAIISKTNGTTTETAGQKS